MICFSRLGNLGQLGNQLFQVAATLAAAKRFETNAKFPTWKYAKFFQQSLDQSLQQTEIANTYVEAGSRFVPVPNLPDMDLFGFFQSHRYFVDQESYIRECFTMKPDLLPADWSNKEADCSIHLRRKDYLKRSHEFVPLQMDYYNRAIERMRKIDCRSFLVFTDDIEWCRHNLPADFTIVDDSLSDVQSLYLMSKCKNHIIANSTFSWWGSWLCQNPDKIVIAPRTWYGFRLSVRQDDHYQYCPNWELIPNKVSLPKQILSLLKSEDKQHFISAYKSRERWMQEEYEMNLKEAFARTHH
jgi:hypothetical protein